MIQADLAVRGKWALGKELTWTAVLIAVALTWAGAPVGIVVSGLAVVALQIFCGLTWARRWGIRDGLLTPVGLVLGIIVGVGADQAARLVGLGSSLIPLGGLAVVVMVVGRRSPEWAASLAAPVERGDVAWLLAPAGLLLWGWGWTVPLAFAALLARAIGRWVGGGMGLIVAGGVLVGGLVMSRWLLVDEWAVVQQEQLFYEAVATSISEFGRGSFLWAAGTPLHFHFLAHAEAGAIQRAIGGGSFVVLPVLLTALLAVGALATFREIARGVDRTHADGTVLIVAVLSGPVIYGQVGPLVVADAPFLLGATALGCALLVASSESLDSQWRSLALVGACVFAATGAKTMYGLIAAVAVTGTALAPTRRHPHRSLIGRASVVIGAGCGCVGALVAFLDLPRSAPAGGSGIFREPPFDFVRKLSTELQVFEGWRAIVIAALITASVVATPLAVLGIAVCDARHRLRCMAVGLIAAQAAGLFMLVFAHTDLYGEQAVFWTAAAGPALAFGTPAALAVLAAKRAAAASSAAAIAALTAISVTASGRLSGSGSTNAIYLRVLAVAVVPIVASAFVLTVLVARSRLRVMTGRAVLLGLCLFGSMISTLRGFHALVVDELPRRESRELALVDRRAEMAGPAAWLELHSAKSDVLAATAGHELEMMNLSLQTRRRFLYLDGGFWTMHVDRRSSAWQTDRTVAERAPLGIEAYVRALAARDVRFALFDSGDVTATYARIVYRDDRWTIVAVPAN